MKVSREQVAEHRTKILAAAARLFRLRGFEDVTVAELMKEAGLTHGAFYGYFPSKEALIAEAVGKALPPAPDLAQPRRPAAEFADGYLSVKHRDNRAAACLFSSLGDGGLARLGRSAAHHDAGRPEPDRAPQCRGGRRHAGREAARGHRGVVGDGRRDGAGPAGRR